MQFSAQQISSLINGKIEGNPDIIVGGFAKIEEALPTDLAFLSNPKYQEYLYSTKAGIVIINEGFELKSSVTSTLIRVKDAYSAFATLMDYYQKMQATKLVGIQEPVYIHPSAKIGKDVYIGAFVYIGENAVIADQAKIHAHTFIGNNAKVGLRTTLHAGVKVYHDCIIGNDVMVHAGTVIGSDGFGFAPQQDGTYSKVPQLGNVVIEDMVEIGANTCIDRATMGSTLIKKGTKLDNLIQIAHNVEIGENTVIAAQSGISGSTKIGNRVVMGGQVGVVGHISIADGTRFAAQSGVSKSVLIPNTALTGNPAYNYNSVMRANAVFRRLPDLEKKILELEALLAALIKAKDSIDN
ncbi:MAG: UDP-3-O-(3-hydroxymyristoyl)glucosamine N-acyltransferase [bacterium]|jgi:UDP-3-O-[3-hydroxymyristoyl] glucosamine N-acyltransferase